MKIQATMVITIAVAIGSALGAGHSDDAFPRQKLFSSGLELGSPMTGGPRQAIETGRLFGLSARFAQFPDPPVNNQRVIEIRVNSLVFRIRPVAIDLSTISYPALWDRFRSTDSFQPLMPHDDWRWMGPRWEHPSIGWHTLPPRRPLGLPSILLREIPTARMARIRLQTQ